MNKTAISLVIVLIVLAINSPIIESQNNEGCCYLPHYAPPRCEYVLQESCDLAGGNFYLEQSCASLDICDEICCCGAGINAFTLKGICNEAGGIVYDTIAEGDCAGHCGVPNLCPSGNCVAITEECAVDDVGTTVEPGEYYCWINNQVYDDQGDCDGECVLAIADCIYSAPITARCSCGGIVYDAGNGYCCWDNSWVQENDGSTCPPGNPCTTHSEAGHYYSCCDACLDDVLSYSDGKVACASADSTKPQCCRDCADPNPLPAEQCCDYAWQCADYGGMILPYNFATCQKIPCDQDCAQPECPPSQQIAVLGGVPEVCWCNDAAYDTSDYADWWCCDTGISDAQCEGEVYSLKGYVYDSRSINIKISGAEIKINDNLKDYSALDGTYRIDNIPLHTAYTVTVTHPNFFPNVTDLLENSVGAYTRNFALRPRVADVCDSANPPAVTDTDFVALHVKGKKQVHLQWSNPCTADPSKVLSYEIVREPSSPTSIVVSETLFVDGNVSWETQYNYTIYAHYESYVSEGAAVTITLGHHYCGDKYNEEEQKFIEFCLDYNLEKVFYSTLRYTCNDTNGLTQYGIDGIRDCSSLDQPPDIDGICIGPDGQGKTSCTIMDWSNNCTADITNPFGLFFTGAAAASEWHSCVGTVDDPRYCYYDYSDTTVDTCYDCNELDSCYGYRSQGACEQDNCEVSGNYVQDVNHGCEWYPTEYAELGKGICYDGDYDEADYCYLCSEDNIHIFSNSYCSQEICNILGACYLSRGSCTSCGFSGADTTTCESFKNQEACVNADGEEVVDVIVQTTSCPVLIRESKDACGIGLCRWTTPLGEGTDRCFKDGDGDNQPDCSQGISGVECRRDLEPAETRLTEEVPVMNSSGIDITFNVVNGDLLSAFKFCLDKIDECCPNKPASIDIVSESSATFNPVEEERDAIDEPGIYYLRYFTIDRHHNIEVIKSVPISIDIIYPELFFNYYTRPEGPDNYTTFEVFSLNEAVYCGYNTSSIDSYVIEDTFDTIFDYSFMVKFKNLPDGNYVFTTDCIDNAGNRLINETIVIVNLYHNAIAQSPDMQILNTTDVKFYLKTLDDSTCVLTSLNNTNETNLPDIPYKLFEGSIEMTQSKITENSFNHTTLETVITIPHEDVSYLVMAECTTLGGITDYAYYHFTIDKKPPVTTTDFGFGVPHAVDQLTLKATLQLECQDQYIPGVPGTPLPGQNGCKDSFICVGYNCNNFERTDFWDFVSEGTYWVSFYSVDNNGNDEPLDPLLNKNMAVIIDNTPPFVKINPFENYITITAPSSSPYAGQKVNVTNQKPQRVWGITDTDREKVKVEIDGIDVEDSNESLADLVGSNGYQLDVSLYDGLNYITVVANDSAGNHGQAKAAIYLDVSPPDISSIMISDAYFDNDPDDDNEFEFGYNLTFKARVEDDMRGVDASEVQVRLHYQDGTVYGPYPFTLLTQGNYESVVEDLLPLGYYTANFSAEDLYGNKADVPVDFSIVDSQAPLLNWIYPLWPAQMDLTFYEDEIMFEGSATEANVNVSFLVNGVLYSVMGGGFSNLITTFDMYGPVGIGLPTENSNEVYILGDVRSQIHTGHYLEFILNPGQIPYWNIPRHKVDDVALGFCFGVTDCTKITLDKQLGRDVESSATIILYDTDRPTGHFNITIPLSAGTNTIYASGKDPNNKPSPVYNFNILFNVLGAALDARIKDHNGVRVDNLQHDGDAEFNYNVVFETDAVHELGIKEVNVTISCVSGLCDNYQEEFNLSYVSGTTYRLTLTSETSLLLLGNYAATLKAWSNDGRSSEKTLWFYVDDTIGPSVSLYYPPESAQTPETAEMVYNDYISVTGLTEPGANLTILLLNGTPPHSPIGDYSAQAQEAISLQLASHPLFNGLVEKYPTAQDNSMHIIGHVRDDFIDKYLEFTIDGGDYQPLPRFEVISAVEKMCFLNSPCTQIVVDRPLGRDVLGSGTAHIFTTQYPTGYFNKTTYLIDELNIVGIFATDINGQTGAGKLLYVFYNSSPNLGFGIVEPSRIISNTRVVNLEDFNNNGEKIIVEIETNNFNTECTITHPDNYNIAPSFTDEDYMISANGRTHVYEIDVSDCIENGGNYCLVGGNSVYHHYTISCTALDYQEISDSIGLCFKVDIEPGQGEGNKCSSESTQYCSSYPIAPACAMVDPCDDGSCDLNVDCDCPDYGGCTMAECIPNYWCDDTVCTEQDCSCPAYGDCTEEECGDFDTII